MKSPTPQQQLVIAALLLTPGIFLVVTSVTSAARPVTGYVCVLVVYWACFCLPVAAVFGRGQRPVSMTPSNRPTWVPMAALALPALIFVAAGTAASFDAAPGVIGLAIACAAINAPLEELAWRRSFRANSGGRIGYEILGLFLFGLWHVPLGFSRGVSFDYGFAGLVGGALIHGAFWMFMTRANDSVGWPVASHALVNVAAFLPFFATNSN